MRHWVLAYGLAFLISQTAAVARAQEPAGSAGPRCVTVTLFDRNNAPIVTDKPVVGLMVGGRPVVETDVTEYADIKVLGSAGCPETLVNAVTSSYGQVCLTEERRKAAVLDNRTTIEAINGNCKAIREALGPALGRGKFGK